MPSESKPAASTGVKSVLATLRRTGDARIARQMSERFGITGPTAETAFGHSVGELRKLARSLRAAGQGASAAACNHRLAAALWKTGQYEARMVACFLDDPSLVSPAQMDRWAGDFDNWGICDTACFCLFDRVEAKTAFGRVRAWARSRDEFVKRGAFALLASLALHRKEIPDEDFVRCLPLIERAASDERNFVKKGVSWGLRAFKKRRGGARPAAVACAERLAASEIPSARWIGKDALRDFRK